ncbi:protrudin isoform X2 [Sceloporus undulatus]|uniref:protrudin isoform X2 n=1 Tax=Sceloporus undulatus TaxID=8520 RepID=UPI001C4B97C3|nr:protrudin isoform X2 [Sceloporus undulatus]
MQVLEREGGTATGNGLDSPTASDVKPVSSSPTKPPPLDLFNLVVSYKRLELYLEPLQDVAEGVWFLLSWQMPLCSLLTCLGLNFLLLTLSEGAWYGLFLLLIVVPAILGYLQETCRICLSEEELARRRYHSVRREDVRKVQLTRNEAVAEVKGFLIQLEALLSRLCGSCEAAYRVLYWKNPSLSSQFYGTLMGFLCALYLLPLCWVFVLLNNALFLGNVAFYRVMLELKSSVEQRLGLKPTVKTPAPVELDAGEVGTGALPDRTPTPTSVEDLTPGSVEEAEEAEPDDEFKDAIEEDDDISQCSGEFELGLPENPLMSKNEAIRRRVSQLRERLRKRYPSNNLSAGLGGSCASCSATFSVLKKRRSCSNCGNIFCSRCCSFKVPKSCMGATAPDAQRETVFVCGHCNQALIK